MQHLVRRDSRAAITTCRKHTFDRIPAASEAAGHWFESSRAYQPRCHRVSFAVQDAEKLARLAGEGRFLGGVDNG